ncbi:hypothetical protein RQP46_006212 [Phenoliferia psychrophenolica]
MGNASGWTQAQAKLQKSGSPNPSQQVWSSVPSGHEYAYAPGEGSMRIPEPYIPSGLGGNDGTRAGPVEDDLDEVMRRSRDEAEFHQARQESQQAEEERLLRLTSSYSAEQEQLRQARLQQDALAEESALRDALAASREGKGKARSSAADEDADFELALALSLSEAQSRATSRGETTAEAFARLSRVEQDEGYGAGGSGRRQDSFLTSSQRPHPAFDVPHISASPTVDDYPTASTSSGGMYVSNPDPEITTEPQELPPPAYEYPETDLNPRTVVLGPVPASLRSSPLFGGLVASSSNNAIADDFILLDVRFGFLPSSFGATNRATNATILEHEGAFPDVAQLSRLGGPEGDSLEYQSFAVEAGGWGGLLKYLMWHGNSHFEAAPRDLQAEKSGRGLDVAIVVEFFRSPTHPRSPRVRCRLELLPASHTYDPLSPSFASLSYPSLHPESPLISVLLPRPPRLPLTLAALAMALSDAHTLSRKHGFLTNPHPHARALKNLAPAIDLFKGLNGESVVGDAEEVEEEEKSALRRLKGRLKRRKKAPGVVKGALLVTPFRLDSS